MNDKWASSRPRKFGTLHVAGEALANLFLSGAGAEIWYTQKAKTKF